MAEPLLEVIDLKTHFFTPEGTVRAVDGVNYNVFPGETLGLVGESGSGKTVSALSLMRLIPNPPGKIVGGEVTFAGEDILKADEDRMREIRGNDITMVFQEPMTSLNPVLTISTQVTEALELHLQMNHRQAVERTVELLHMVGIPAAAERLDDYPHQFSGGMRQRVMIAMALACDPKLLLADEPTTALDVTIQAQVLEVMARLSREMGTAVIVITHNLGVVARYADRVNVMYAGRIVETSTAAEIYGNPRHAYTLGLLESVPRLDTRQGSLIPIEGVPPDLINLPSGCAFNPRCRFATDVCREERPDLTEFSSGHFVACWHPDEVGVEAQAQVMSVASAADGASGGQER